jgi:hypothetical protein
MKTRKTRIDGREAVRLDLESAKRKPVQLQPATENQEPPASRLLPPRQNDGEGRKAPPRVRKPSAMADRCVAPTLDLGKHRKSLRETFGATLSDEFVDVLLGKLIEGLRPSAHSSLEEATLNAALAIVDSMHPQSEHEALLAVQYVVLSFCSQKFLRLSQHHLIDDYVEFYGPFAFKLHRLQIEVLRAYDRHRRGNKQIMEIKHVHIYPGGQGIVGIVNKHAGPEEESDK